MQTIIEEKIKFSKEWKGQGYEKGETALFYRDFFDIFQINVRRVAQFEQYVKLLGNKRGYIDLIWKGVLLVEQKSDGVGLVKAEKQALKYFEGLEDHEVPRYVLLSFLVCCLTKHWHHHIWI